MSVKTPNWYIWHSVCLLNFILNNAMVVLAYFKGVPPNVVNVAWDQPNLHFILNRPRRSTWFEPFSSKPPHSRNNRVVTYYGYFQIIVFMPSKLVSRLIRPRWISWWSLFSFKHTGSWSTGWFIFWKKTLFHKNTPQIRYANKASLFVSNNWSQLNSEPNSKKMSPIWFTELENERFQNSYLVSR